jgi:hypothetical protein
MKKSNSQKGSTLAIILVVAVVVIVGIVLAVRHSPTAVVPTPSETPSVSVSPSTTVSPSGSVVPVAPITYSVAPTKETFMEGEDITFTFIVTNNTTDAKTFNFNSGCQTSYSIGTVDGSKNVVCTTALTSFTIAPKSTKSFTLTHHASDFRFPVGVFTLKARLIGYGEAQSRVKIVNATEPAPKINSIFPASASIGTTVAVSGANLAGFEGDKNLWIVNAQGQKGIIMGDAGSTGEVIKFSLADKYCTQDTSYSGLPCPGYVNIIPGVYTIYSMPWGTKSNEVKLTVVAQPGITILSPKGGENWKVSQTYTVSFTVNGEFGPITVNLNKYSDDGVLLTSTNIGTTYTSGNLSYTVPASIDPTRGNAGRYKIEAYPGTARELVTRSGYFSITK